MSDALGLYRRCFTAKPGVKKGVNMVEMSSHYVLGVVG